LTHRGRQLGFIFTDRRDLRANDSNCGAGMRTGNPNMGVRLLGEGFRDGCSQARLAVTGSFGSATGANAAFDDRASDAILDGLRALLFGDAVPRKSSETR
jgi:hypothetical protein